MFPVWAIQPLVSAGTSAAKWLFGRREKFDQTPMGRALKRRAEKGLIPLTSQQNVISNVAQQAGNAASIAKAEERGRLASTGMGDSISGTANLRGINRSFQDRLAMTARDLAAQNEATKPQAELDLAQGQTAFDEQRRAEKNEMLGGLFGAAGQLVAGGIQNKALKQIQEKYAAGGMSDTDFMLGLKNLGIEDPYNYIPAEEVIGYDFSKNGQPAVPAAGVVPRLNAGNYWKKKRGIGMQL
jgi:hypothetical protein